MYPNPYESPDLNLPPKGFGSKVYAYPLLPHQSIPNNAATQLRLNAERYDLLDEFNPTVGNYSFTPKKAGYYLLIAHVTWGPLAAAGESWLYLIVTGVIRQVVYFRLPAAGYQGVTFSIMDYLTPNDIVRVYVYQNTGVAETIRSDWTRTWLCTHRLS